MTVARPPCTSAPACRAVTGRPSSRTCDLPRLPPGRAEHEVDALALHLRVDRRAGARGGRLRADRPLAAVGEEVERQPALRAGRSVPARLGRPAPSPPRAPCRGTSRAWSGRRDDDVRGRASAPSCAPRLGEQRADRRLGLVVVALAEVRVADLAARVDQVLAGQYWLLHAFQVAMSLSWATGYVMPFCLIASRDVAGVLLEGELGRVHADDRQPPSR